MNDESKVYSENEDLDSLGDEQEPIPDDELWKQNKCFWRMNEPNRIRWDLFIMVLAIWNWFSIPFQAAFDPPVLRELWIELINSLIDIIFMFDVAIWFRTTFVNSKTGEEEYDTKKIAKNYFYGRFWIDILASLPLDLMGTIISEDGGNTTFLKLFGLLKLIRVLRLSRIIMYLNFKEDVKSSLRLIKLIFFLVMYMHWQACGWYIMVKGNEIWIPPLDWVWVGTHLYEEPTSYKYWTCMFHSASLLSGNDIGPRNVAQLLFWTTALLVCAIINANIFGNIAVLVSSMNRKLTQFQDKIDTVNTAMKNMKLPEETQKKVQAYIMSTQSTLDHQQEMDDFLKMISPSLKLEVTRHIFSVIVTSNQMFSENTDLVDYLVKYLHTCLFLPEDVIINQGDEPDSLFFLAKGELVVIIYDENNEERYVNTLKLGAYFGEVGIIRDWPRTATVKSKNYTTCAKLVDKNFKDFRNRYPKIIREMNDNIIQYQDRWKKFLKKTLKFVSFLSHDIDDVILEELMYELDSERCEAGNYLFKKGWSWDCIYIIIHGEMEIYMDSNGNGRETYIETLHQSWNIGTYATLQEEDYSFSCKAKTDWSVMQLKFETLDQLRSKYEELDYYLLEYEGFIEESGAPFWDFLIYRPRNKSFKPIDIFVKVCKRMESILKSYSKKIEFGDILKRVQETIRKERAEEKLEKKKKFDEENKPQNQADLNGKMILDLRSNMDILLERLASQKLALKSLIDNPSQQQDVTINQKYKVFRFLKIFDSFSSKFVYLQNPVLFLSYIFKHFW